MSRNMRFPTMWYVRPVKAQASLRIRKCHIVGNHVSRLKYLSSKKGKDLSIEDLTTNLKTLVRHAFTIPAEHVENEQHIPILEGKHVRHKFQTTSTDFTWWQGKVISQVKKQTNKTTTGVLCACFCMTPFQSVFGV